MVLNNYKTATKKPGKNKPKHKLRLKAVLQTVEENP
jgi:hypothetical protein